MPIVLAPPEPLDPSISAGYGAAEMQVQQYPQIVAAASAAAQHQLGLARLGEGGGGGDAALAQNMALRYGQANQESAQNAALTQQGAAADQQSVLQGQAAQQKVAVYQAEQNIDFTQAQKLQMQELQNDVAWIQGQTNLTPQEKQAMMTQAAVPLSFLKKQKAAADAQIQQTQSKQLQQQFDQQQHFRAQGTTAQIEDAAMVAKNGPRLIFQGADGQTYHVNPKDLSVSPVKAAAPAKDTSGADAQKAMDAEEKHVQADRKEYTDAMKEAKRIVKTEREETEGAGTEKKVRYPELADPKVGADNEAKHLHELLGIPVATSAENKLTMEQHLAMRKTQRDARMGKAVQGAMPGGPSPVGQGQTAPQSPQQATEDAPHFLNGQPVTDAQKSAMKDFNQTRQLVQKSSLPTSAKDMYDEQVRHAEHYLSKYGSAARMRQQDPPAFAHFSAILRSLDDIASHLSKPKPPPTRAEMAPQPNATPWLSAPF